MNTERIILNRYYDPGHSWLQVPRYLLEESDCEAAISPYSYFKRGFAYLEEDCDLTTFWQATKLKGMSFKINDVISNDDSIIRGYPSYPSSSRWNENAQAISAAYDELAAATA